MRFGLFQFLFLAAASLAAPPPSENTREARDRVADAPAGTPPSVPAVVASASALPSEEIRSRAQRRVFQLVTKVAEGSEKQSYGTAFVIDRNGYLITNFHVVSSAALNPKKYRLLLNVGSDALPATLLRFDVLNDLALVQVDRKFDDEYVTATRPPAMGEKVFLIGVPEDTVMTLIEGNFSDVKPMGPVKRMIASAPLNHGMSGGPVVSNRDELVGVNDAILEKAQNLSILIPSEYVRPLSEGNRIPASIDVSNEIQRQIKMGVGPWIAKWSSGASPLQSFKLGEFKVAAPPPNSRCWEDVKNSKDKELRVRFCQGSDGFTVTTDNRGGALLLSYYLVPKGVSSLVDTRKSLLESAASEFRKSTRSKDGYLGRYVCSSRYLKNASGVGLMAEYCITPVKEIKELADAIVTFTSLDGASRLVGVMSIHGLPKSELLSATSTFINGVSTEGKK